MSVSNKPDIRYGITGWVELTKTKAKKYMQLNDLYWLKEYTTLLYLWKYNHSNIIRYESGSYLNNKPPNQSSEDVYYELVFPNYGDVLLKQIIYKDKDVIQIMVDLLSAISLCHSLNIWHRDIKPNNILINKSHRAILIDFTHSIRIRTDEFTLENQIATYSHRAPEIFKYLDDKTTKYTEKVDIFALGIILYEMVTNCSLYNQIRDHSEEEVKSFYLDQTEAEYIKEIKKLYTRHKRTLFWGKIYWGWIEKMILFDYKQRPSANRMLSEILKFAVDNSIKIETPVWLDVKNSPQIIKEYTLTEMQIDLFDACIEKADAYRKACCMSFNTIKLMPVMEFLIHEKTITNMNYKEMVFALCVCIDAVIYDNITYIVDAVKMLSKKLRISMKSQKVYSMIIALMQSHDSDLFLSDRFNFFSEVDQLCREPAKNNKSVLKLGGLGDTPKLSGANKTPPMSDKTMGKNVDMTPNNKNNKSPNNKNNKSPNNKNNKTSDNKTPSKTLIVR
jgi:serine/threonine protein kinase